MTVTEKVPLALFPSESVTFTVNVADPATGVVPDNTPALDKLNPTAVNALDPDVTDQVYPVPDPPVAAKVTEYAVPP